MVEINQCKEAKCCCKCTSLKRLTEFNHGNRKRLDSFCCVTFLACSDTVIFSPKPHGLCENFIRIRYKQ